MSFSNSLCGFKHNLLFGEFKRGGILFLIYLGKVSFSGEVGGYPQALLKVVNLQGMLDFHRNFHLIKRVKIVVCCGGVQRHAC